MGYRLMGLVHAQLLALRSDRGQGTVEYVGLMLVLAVILGAVVKVAGDVNGEEIPKAIVTKLKETISSVGANAK